MPPPALVRQQELGGQWWRPGGEERPSPVVAVVGAPLPLRPMAETAFLCEGQEQAQPLRWPLGWRHGAEAHGNVHTHTRTHSHARHWCHVHRNTKSQARTDTSHYEHCFQREAVHGSHASTIGAPPARTTELLTMEPGWVTTVREGSTGCPWGGPAVPLLGVPHPLCLPGQSHHRCQGRSPGWEGKAKDAGDPGLTRQ